MRILVLADDYWHPLSTVRAGLAPLSGVDSDFDWVDDGKGFDPGALAAYALVILSKSNNVTQADRSPWVTAAVEQAFVQYVCSGGGLLGLHSGTVYRDTDRLGPLLGGVFVKHPPQCDVTVTPLSGHPLTRGAMPFTAKDEHYQMEMVSDDVDVFLTTTSQYGTQPGGWTRCEGAGRVCVLTPGHNLAVWLEPAYQALLANAMRWCAGSASARPGPDNEVSAS